MPLSDATGRREIHHRVVDMRAYVRDDGLYDIEAHLVDVIWLVMSRHVLLGGGGPGWSEGLRVPSVTRALKVSRSKIASLGPDWLCTIVPEYAQWWDPETGHV